MSDTWFDPVVVSRTEYGSTTTATSTTTYTYDNRDRLIREVRTGNGAFDMAYTYDQLGNRLTKTARDGSGVITKLTEYAYDVTAPDENFPTHNNRLLKYLEYVPDEGPALGGTPAFVHTRAYTAGSGTEIDEAGGGRLQRHSDLIGSTVCTSDDSGAAQPPSNRPVYTAFGELVAGSPGSRYGYAGDHGYEGAAGPAPGPRAVFTSRHPSAATAPHQPSASACLCTTEPGTLHERSTRYCSRRTATWS